MPPNPRGRMPGPVGAEGRWPEDSSLQQRGSRSHGPLRERDRIMLAEVAQPAADTATDAVQPGPEQQLTEPFHVSGDHASLREFNLQLIDQVTGPQP